MPTLRHLSTSLALLGMSLASAHAQTALHCDVTYAGQTQRIAVTRTDDAYTVPSVAIGGRFRFKALQVQGALAQPRVDLYVYRQDEDRAVLIQHVAWSAPLPEPPIGATVDWTGKQHLYSGPLERELIYQCFAQRPAP